MAEEAPKPNVPAPAEKAQPKIVHKLAIRTLLALFSLAALFFGLRGFLDYSRDPNRYGVVDTADTVAAIEFLDNGQQVVLLKEGAEPLRSPDFTPGNTERDLAWQPDGNRLYYVSDRDKSTFQVYRWRPVKGGESEARTIGTRGKSNPTFPADATAGSDLLICSGGVVLELDPVKRTTHQILPPLTNEIAVSNEDEGGGGTSQFAGFYGQLGESFSRAQYLPNGEAVIAIMKRDRGEVLVAQPLKRDGDKIPRPIPVVAGEKISFSIAPTGLVAYSVQSFQWPANPPEDMVKNGKVMFPFLHAIGTFELGKEAQMPIAISNDNKVVFGNIRLSPDGTRLLAIAGNLDENGFVPKGLAVMPAQPGGAQAGSPLINGEVYEPSWDSTGKRIAYVKKVEGRRAIYTINADGSGETMLTPKGSFGQPVFSPQVKKAAP